ncbi:unnamed protein product, partial [Symbiodinium sp. CCMP2592]
TAARALAETWPARAAWAESMLTQQELDGLLQLLKEANKPFDTLAGQFYKQFPKSEQFRAGCVISMLLQDQLLTQAQRLVSYYLLYDIYRNDRGTERETATIPFVPLVVELLETSHDAVERKFLLQFLSNPPKDLHKKTVNQFVQGCDGNMPDLPDLDAVRRIFQQEELTMNSLEPCWARPVPPLLEPLVDEVFWLSPSLMSEPLWDWTMKDVAEGSSTAATGSGSLFGAGSGTGKTKTKAPGDQKSGVQFGGASKVDTKGSEDGNETTSFQAADDKAAADKDAADKAAGDKAAAAKASAEKAAADKATADKAAADKTAADKAAADKAPAEEKAAADKAAADKAAADKAAADEAAADKAAAEAKAKADQAAAEKDLKALAATEVHSTETAAEADEAADDKAAADKDAADKAAGDKAAAAKASAEKAAADKATADKAAADKTAADKAAADKAPAEEKAAADKAAADKAAADKAAADEAAADKAAAEAKAKADQAAAEKDLKALAATVHSTETAAEADEIPLATFDLLRPPMAAQAAPGPVSPNLPSNGSLGHPDLCGIAPLPPQTSPKGGNGPESSSKADTHMTSTALVREKLLRRALLDLEHFVQQGDVVQAQAALEDAHIAGAAQEDLEAGAAAITRLKGPESRMDSE